MADILKLADQLWKGEARLEDHYPMAIQDDFVEISDNIAFVPSFGNVVVFRTDEGLVLIDTASFITAPSVHERIRQWSQDPVHTIIYSHGHVDHVMGVVNFEQDPIQKGKPIRVIAHENAAGRFDRYKLTAEFNAWINRRQFQVPQLQWPTSYRYPDETFRDTMSIEVGGLRFELNHAKGETDDGVWTWLPDLAVLCPGDLFIWTIPNAGNPQKVQRYAATWAVALRTMASLGAKTMLPGHGFPVMGDDRIQLACDETAEVLEALHSQTVEWMNKGVRLDEIIHRVKAPQHLLDRPYLRPIYDEPEFIIRNIWRLYGGWYDGNPANLKPAPESELARELADAAGGAITLAKRAQELAKAGDLRLASHLAEFAAQADPQSAEVHNIRAEVYEKRALHEDSLMARGIFTWAAGESRSAANDPDR